MVVVEASLSLVTVSVLVATVLEIFHRLGQEILLLLTLTERFLKLDSVSSVCSTQTWVQIWFVSSSRNKLPAV